MDKLTLETFIAAAIDAEPNTDYLEAVWNWATDYALPLDDAEYILDAAADKYAGEFASPAEFAESIYSELYNERIEEIRSLAEQTPIIELTFNWEQTARLVMPNTPGMDYAEFNGHYFWAAD